MVTGPKEVKYPSHRPTWPGGDQELKAPRFIDTRHTKVVRSSPPRTGRLYPQEYPGTHFFRGSVDPGHMDLSDDSEKKIASDTTGDRSWDLPISSVVVKALQGSIGLRT